MKKKSVSFFASKVYTFHPETYNKIPYRGCKIIKLMTLRKSQLISTFQKHKNGKEMTQDRLVGNIYSKFLSLFYSEFLLTRLRLSTHPLHLPAHPYNGTFIKLGPRSPGPRSLVPGSTVYTYPYYSGFEKSC